MPEPEFSYHYFVIDEVLFITIKGDLLGYEKETELVHLVNTYSNHLAIVKVVADTSGIQHINSVGLNTLLRILTHLDDNHGVMVIFNPSAQLKRLLSITKLDLVFKTTDSRSEAYQIIKHA